MEKERGKEEERKRKKKGEGRKEERRGWRWLPACWLQNWLNPKIFRRVLLFPHTPSLQSCLSGQQERRDLPPLYYPVMLVSNYPFSRVNISYPFFIVLGLVWQSGVHKAKETFQKAWSGIARIVINQIVNDMKLTLVSHPDPVPDRQLSSPAPFPTLPYHKLLHQGVKSLWKRPCWGFRKVIEKEHRNQTNFIDLAVRVIWIWISDVGHKSLWFKRKDQAENRNVESLRS